MPPCPPLAGRRHGVGGRPDAGAAGRSVPHQGHAASEVHSQHRAELALPWLATRQSVPGCQGAAIALCPATKRLCRPENIFLPPAAQAPARRSHLWSACCS
eukprot:365825-Chlamydomonas_euryale.AAC.5